MLFFVPNTHDPISLRFQPEFHERLQNAADQIGLPKHSFCQMALKAAVQAVENADGKLVLPLDFEVKYVPGRKNRAVKKRQARKI